jgi:hypothetical protein
MNQPVNAAGTPEYAAFRENFESSFNIPPQEIRHIDIGGDQNLYAEVSYYQNHKTQKVTIKTSCGEAILEYKVYDFHITLLDLIKHKNGREYLIFKRDLYGYSVMDVSTREVADYIPADVLKGIEAFIWTDTLYCPHTNVLAANGCYWACPYATEFYDFTDPMKMPLPFLGDSYNIVKARYGDMYSSEVTRYFDDGKWYIKIDDEFSIDIANL